MGILKGIFKSRNVNERSAMQMTAVYSCVRILSEVVASLPLHVYKYNANGGKEKAVKHPLYFSLHDEPNPEMTPFVFWETLMTHLLATAQNTMHDRYIILDYGKRNEKNLSLRRFIQRCREKDNDHYGSPGQNGLQAVGGYSDKKSDSGTCIVMIIFEIRSVWGDFFVQNRKYRTQGT